MAAPAPVRRAPPPRQSSILTGSAIPMPPRRPVQPEPAAPSTPAQPPVAAAPAEEVEVPAIRKPEAAILAGLATSPRKQAGRNRQALIAGGVVSVLGFGALTTLILTSYGDPHREERTAQSATPVGAVSSPVAPVSEPSSAAVAASPAVTARTPVPQTNRIAQAAPRVAPLIAQPAPVVPRTIAVETAPLAVPPVTRPEPVMPAPRPPADPDAPLSTRLPDGTE